MAKSLPSTASAHWQPIFLALPACERVTCRKDLRLACLDHLGYCNKVLPMAGLRQLTEKSYANTLQADTVTAATPCSPRPPGATSCFGTSVTLGKRPANSPLPT